MGSTRSASAGLSFAGLGFYDEDGNFLVGGTRTAPANGDVNGSPFARILAVKSGTPPANAPETTQITGDDGLVAEIDFSNIGSRQFVIEVAVQDLDLIAAVDGSAVRTSGRVRFVPVDSDDIPDRDAAIILQSRSVKTANGQAGYTGVFIPRAIVRYLGRGEATEREAAAYQFSVTPQLTRYEPWGVTMTTAANGKTQTRTFPFDSTQPVWMQVWTGDGAETDFVAQHDLVGASALEVWVDRVPVAVSSVINNTISLSVAPGAGRPIIAMYEFEAFND